MLFLHGQLGCRSDHLTVADVDGNRLYDVSGGRIPDGGPAIVDFQSFLADLDIARNGPRASYERCDAYIVKTLEPIYA